ncbi:MAG: hypothetical protein A2033_05980 [Bacteroidetes bacterium GWA2_31_9]|nr:MAG: hypothetical protein A2033_05980 [Bacteroidetes bacterium GWA2_31_9]
MAKLILIFCASILLNTRLLSQNNDSISFIYEIGIEEFNCWNEIYSSWHNETFYKLLKSKNIKMNCSDCESFYCLVEFCIKDSIIESYSIIKENFCGKNLNNDFKTKYLEYFLQYSYPEILYNKRFKVRLGDSLKC